MSGRARRSLGLSSEIYYDLPKESKEAALRRKLRTNVKFMLPDGKPDLNKIEWFIGKLKKEGKL